MAINGTYIAINSLYIVINVVDNSETENGNLGPINGI